MEIKLVFIMYFKATKGCQYGTCYFPAQISSLKQCIIQTVARQKAKLWRKTNLLIVHNFGQGFIEKQQTLLVNGFLRAPFLSYNEGDICFAVASVVINCVWMVAVNFCLAFCYFLLLQYCYQLQDHLCPFCSK